MKYDPQEILASVSGQDGTITYPRLYLELTGNHTSACLLSEIIALTHRHGGWFPMSAEYIQQRLGLTSYQVVAAIGKKQPKRRTDDRPCLAELGVEREVRKAYHAESGSYVPTAHYRIDMAVFIEQLSGFQVSSKPHFESTSHHPPQEGKDPPKAEPAEPDPAKELLIVNLSFELARWIKPRTHNPAAMQPYKTAARSLLDHHSTISLLPLKTALAWWIDKYPDKPLKLEKLMDYWTAYQKQNKAQP